VFVGSPLEDTQDSLVKLGKRLRKNNVLVDVVSFGEEGMANDEKLGALIEAAGGGESYVQVSPDTIRISLTDLDISSRYRLDRTSSRMLSSLHQSCSVRMGLTQICHLVEKVEKVVHKEGIWTQIWIQSWQWYATNTCIYFFH
jgi:hypothetical protein